MARATSEYNKKRNFNITSEPRDDSVSKKSTATALRFVIQKHDARRLHYDFRLELDGSLKSWAVPKGPSLDPKEKRLAVHVEDHPISYASFEGHIPHGQYGGGDVIVWDQGIWQPQGDPKAGYKSGKLKFSLTGEKLIGNWALVKTNLRGSGDKEQWLLIKEKDEFARTHEDYDIVEDRPESVKTGKLLPIDQSPSSSRTEKKSTKTKEKKSEVTTIESAKQKRNSSEKASEKSKTSSKDAAIPSLLSPELATLVSEPPPGEWLYEIKFDGYRLLTRIENGEVKFFTRNGHDWTEKFAPQRGAIEALGLDNSWLDGEIVVLDKNGLPSFQLLQNAIDNHRTQDIIYYLFDVPFLEGEDLREQPLEKRRIALKKAIGTKQKKYLRFSEVFEADHRSIVESACSMSLEGVIGKRAGSHYVSRRSQDWIKLKCRLRQEFVIIGYTEPQGSRTGFGAILLGIHKEPQNPELIYAGRVGTGFNEKKLTDMLKKMHKLERKTPAITSQLTATQKRGVHWVEPQLVCEVEFAEWTSDGVLRQASFIALRSDKPAKDIIREHAKTINSSDQKKITSNKKSPTEKSTSIKNKKISIAGISVSHPDRIIDKESGQTKLDLVQFYESISNYILPHLAQRPVSLLRAPEGIEGEQFFQKHSENKAIPHITHLNSRLDPGHGPLMQIDKPQALISCVQMNAVEFHTWGAQSKQIETPDRFVLDLDPDPALPWRSVIEATKLTLAVLDELKLDAYLKTTGGKGMHILVPLTPDADWDSVKAFSKAISQFMEKQIPERFVAKMGPKNRIGKIFIDYLRNSRGASTVAAYSVRARENLPVSVPVSKSELDKITSPNYWHIGNLHQRLDKLKANPWQDYDGNHYNKKQKISKTMWKKLGISEPKLK